MSAPEPVLAALPRERAEAIRLAFDWGPGTRLATRAGATRPRAAAMCSSDALGVRWERRRAVVNPLGGGQGHDPGASPMDGHGHGSQHVHQRFG